MFVSHFRGLSVTFDGLYTSFTIRMRCILSLQMKVTPLQFFLSSHYCQNGNQTILTHPRHLTLCVWEVMVQFDRWSRFQTWKNVHLNSTLNWRTLHGLSMYRQHCREFWGWAVDRFKPYTKMCISSLFVVKNNFWLENLNEDETPTAALYVEWDYLSDFAVQYIDTLAT